MPKIPTQPAHHSTVQNVNTFPQAIALALAAPGHVYHTTAGTPFTVDAGTVSRGRRKDQEVLVFKQNGKEMARAYMCCWGHITNCNRTYINSYTPLI